MYRFRICWNTLSVHVFVLNVLIRIHVAQQSWCFANTAHNFALIKHIFTWVKWLKVVWKITLHLLATLRSHLNFIRLFKVWIRFQKRCAVLSLLLWSGLQLFKKIPFGLNYFRLFIDSFAGQNHFSLLSFRLTTWLYIPLPVSLLWLVLQRSSFRQL